MKRFLLRALVGATLLAGCGFHLKGTQDLAHVPRVQLHSDEPALTAVLRRRLQQQDVALDEDAPIKLQVRDFQRRRQQAAIGTSGQNKEIEFTDSFVVRVERDGVAREKTLVNRAYLQYQTQQYLGSVSEEKRIEERLFAEDGDKILQYFAAVSRCNAADCP